MGAVEFASIVIAASAWPIDAVVIALSQRRAVGGLLRRVTRGKVGWFEVEAQFERFQDALGHAAEEAPPGVPEAEAEAQRRRALEDVVRHAAALGFQYHANGGEHTPWPDIEWTSAGTPIVAGLRVKPDMQGAMERRLVRIRSKEEANRRSTGPLA